MKLEIGECPVCSGNGCSACDESGEGEAPLKWGWETEDEGDDE